MFVCTGIVYWCVVQDVEEVKSTCWKDDLKELIDNATP